MPSRKGVLPWQLKEGLRKHPRGSRSQHPIAEQLPSININELQIPKDYQNHVMSDPSLRWPFVSRIRVSCAAVELTIPSPFRRREPKISLFKLKPIFTGIGVRYALICQCGKPAIKLYFYNNTVACKRCHRVRMASQACNQHQRPVLQATRIASVLDNAPRLFKRTRARLEKRLGLKTMMYERFR
jgi:hypothetical protein